MKLYRINRRAGILAWLALFMWFVCAAALVIFLAAGNPYWPVTLVGLAFLILWGSFSYNYPRLMLVSPGSMAFIMAGDNIVIADNQEMKREEVPGAYVIVVERDGKKSKRRLKVQKHNITGELRRDIEKIKVKK